MQVLTISTYDYIWNTCLHYSDELELLCIALGCDCYMVNVIQHNYSSLIQCLRFSHIDLCYVTTAAAVTITTNCFCYCSYYYCYCYWNYQNYQTTVLLNTLLQRFYIPGVVELTTQLLRLINILWLPLCRINKFCWNTTLEDCRDPLYLWVNMQLPCRPNLS